MSSPLIDAPTLARRLNDPSWIAVDCRFRLTQPEVGPALYAQGHIPGARYAHLDRDLASPPGPRQGRHPLPEPHDFAATLGGWGISNASTVVVYDDASGAIAARLWWMLRWAGHEPVHVLDGGLQSWEAEGLPMESGQVAPEPATFSLGAVRREWLVATDEIEDEIARGAALVDARGRERFLGQSEPIDPVAGHVPGGINFPFSQVLDSAGKFREPAALRQELEEFAEHPRGVITMCGSGVTACHLLLALKTAGLGDGRAYVGSWSEWIRDPARPVATGTPPP